MDSKFKQAIKQFDSLNTLDPNTTIYKGKSYPKELLYAHRMTKTLLNYKPDATETVQLAVRSQHICRWEIPRSTYEQNRTGYLKWRKELAKFHASKASAILKSLNFDNSIIENVNQLLLKKGLKTNEDVQLLEDVVCLVFLKYYFEEFSIKYSSEKVTEILRKTWVKMSGKAHKIALQYEYTNRNKKLIEQALNLNS